MVRLPILLLLAVLAAPALADEELLNGAYTEEGGAEPASATSRDAETEPLSDGGGSASAPVAPEKAASPSARFSLEDRTRFRRWIAGLCREAPLNTPDGERVRALPGKKLAIARAANKQGSLVLLLENYADLTELRDACEAKRKTDATACLVRGHVPAPALEKRKHQPWEQIGAKSFWDEISQNRAPAGVSHVTDVLDSSRASLKAVQNNLTKSFFELRDAADLDGKPGSAEKARRLLSAVKSDSTCGTRSVRESAATPRRQK